MSNPNLFEFSTSAYPASEKFDAWREQNKLAGVVPAEAGAHRESTFDSQFIGLHINQLRLGALEYTTKFESDPMSYEAIRCMRYIREDGFDHYYFRSSRTTAWRGSKFDRADQAQPFEIGVADLTQPYQVEIRAGSAVIVIVPRELIPFDLSKGHGTIVRGTLAVLTSQYLYALAAHLREISAQEIAHVGQATLGMLTAMLMPTQDNLRQVQSEVKIEMFQRIKDCINEHLESPSLNVDSICKTAGLSRASLYRLFSANNIGVNEYIKVARLRRIYSALSAPSAKSLRLSDLAERYGFYSMPAMTRDFKRYFGYTPRDVQQGAVGMAGEARVVSPYLVRDFRSWHYC
jgi:AraC-like DNA-binding protein